MCKDFLTIKLTNVILGKCKRTTPPPIYVVSICRLVLFTEGSTAAWRGFNNSTSLRRWFSPFFHAPVKPSAWQHGWKARWVSTVPAITCACIKGTVSRDLGIFKWIYIGRTLFRDPPLIFLKLLCSVVIELFHLKDPMRLMQKTYLFPVQIGMPLANASKICRIHGYSTPPNYW